MKRIIVLAAVAAVCASVAFAQAESYDIGADLTGSTENWEQSADDFAVDRGRNGFKFADNRKRDVVVCRVPGMVTYFGTPVMETRVYFKNRCVSGVELSLYNKGDAASHGGVMSEKGFDEMIERVSAKVSGADGKVPQTVRVRVKNDRTKMGHKFTRSWPKRTPSAELTWGISGERDSKTLEYARLVFSGGVATGKRSAASKSSTRGGTAKPAGFVANVKRNDEGDVYVANVPMVDQGDKGYCAAAAAERVLRYFGQDMDEHEIAQLAGTSAGGGTSARGMITAVETIGKKCKLGKREVVTKIGSWEDVEKRLKAYNKEAKHLKKPELNLNDYVTVSGHSRTVDIGDMEKSMDPKVQKAMSMKDKAGYAKFIRGIREQTVRGVPLFWSVQLGVYPEPGIPQTAGGHMRLIIGYNEEKGEIIYSDTWGAGHERKHMPDDWAWTITHNLFFLNPR